MDLKITIDDIDVTEHVITSSFQKEDNLNNTVDTLSFTMSKTPDLVFEPDENSEIVVVDQDTDTTLFGGYISEVSRSLDGLLLDYDITCVDYTAELNRYLVFERFEDISAQEAILFMIDKYAPGFTATNVNAGEFYEEATTTDTFNVGEYSLVVKDTTTGPYYYGPTTGGNTEGIWSYSLWG